MKKLIQSTIAVCLLSAAFAFGQVAHVVNIPDPTPTAIQKPVNVHIIAKHADGTVFSDNWVHNLRTTGGADWQAAAMAGTQPAPITYFALSNNGTAPAAGDCAAGSTTCTLNSEISTNSLARATAAYSHTNGTNTFSETKTWTVTGGAVSVQEAGWFDASSSGTMVFEAAFTQVNLVATDTFTATWTVTY